MCSQKLASSRLGFRTLRSVALLLGCWGGEEAFAARFRALPELALEMEFEGGARVMQADALAVGAGARKVMERGRVEELTRPMT